MVAWPASLPQRIHRDTYTEVMAENRIKDPFDQGPSGMRRRTVANPFPIGGRMLLTSDQWSTLRTFFFTTLVQGALSFTFPQQGGTNPLANWTVRFTSPPVRGSVGAYWPVQLQLEVIGSAPDTELPFEGEFLYWVDGLPFEGLESVDAPTGGVKFWADGLPASYTFVDD